MRLSLIVAMSDNRVIGHRGELPWRLSADLRRFKALTMGHHLIMGRRTFESIGRLLPGRRSVVVTRQTGYNALGAAVAHDLDAALKLAEGDEEVFVIGGAEIYRLALPNVERLYVTRVQTEVTGDAFFPEFDETQWRLSQCDGHLADEKNEFDYSFCIYDRIHNTGTAAVNSTTS